MVKVWGRQDLAVTVCMSAGRGVPVSSSQDTRPQTQGSQDLLGLTAASHPLQFVPSRRESWKPVYLRFGRAPVTLISLCLHHPDALGCSLIQT